MATVVGLRIGTCLGRSASGGSPRWQYQVSERSPPFAPLLSMNMVDGGKEREAWKIGEANSPCSWSRYPSRVVAPVGGCGPMRSGSGKANDAGIGKENVTMACIREASKLLYGYETKINKRGCV